MPSLEHKQVKFSVSTHEKLAFLNTAALALNFVTSSNSFMHFSNFSVCFQNWHL